jgi:hypothetical protein
MTENNLHFIVGSDATLTAWYYSAGVRIEACVASFETKIVATKWLKYYSVKARTLLVSWVLQGMPAKLIREA